LLYLLDANVLITANRFYYAIDRVPEFWDWLVHLGEQGSIKIPQEVYDEFSDGDDSLAVWARQDEVETSLVLPESVDVALVRHVTTVGYAPDLSDDELETLGRDPFLIAYALVDVGGRTVVTTEVSKRSRVRANRHIPDVCNDFGVPCCNTFELTVALDFTTQWRR
jgi:hypothetical protein